MDSLTRRDFARAVAAGPLAVRSARAADAMPTRRLGRIRFQAGIFGIGSQHLGDLKATQANADRVIGEAIDAGVNYIDTAPTYNVSEERLGRALKGKRDKVFLVSKVETNTSGDVMYQINDSLRKLQTDYLDCVHMHNVGREDRYPDLRQMLDRERGTLGGLLQAKKQGKIRHIGATCHMRPARAVPVLETGEVELFMCTINFVERHIYGFEEKVLPEARRRNIAVIGMKVLGGPVRGGGARLISPEDYQATLRYAWSVPGVAVAIVGVRTPEELRQGLAAARAFQPLEPRELSSVLDRGKTLAAQWGPVRGPVA
ncbi:MAG: aldo/keto reductase [Acidobacteria bacterium]|nr:aldo/keto reductase [Acidobacteriota bacterium]